MTPTQLIITTFGIINLVAFGTMLWDKARAAQPGAERISEGMLFFLATVFGSFGVYAGMFAFRHKNRKWYFVVGIPLLMLQNIAAVYCVTLLFE